MAGKAIAEERRRVWMNQRGREAPVERRADIRCSPVANKFDGLRADHPRSSSQAGMIGVSRLFDAGLQTSRKFSGSLECCGHSVLLISYLLVTEMPQSNLGKQSTTNLRSAMSRGVIGTKRAE